jgi:hypothetical protein
MGDCTFEDDLCNKIFKTIIYDVALLILINLKKARGKMPRKTSILNGCDIVERRHQDPERLVRVSITHMARIEAHIYL